MKVFIVGDTGLLDGLALWPMTTPNVDVLMYVNVNAVPAAVEAELGRYRDDPSIDLTEIVIVGGELRVSADVELRLSDFAPTARVAGGTRFTTPIAIARTIYPPATPTDLFIPVLEGPKLMHDGNPTVMSGFTHDDGSTRTLRNVKITSSVRIRSGTVIIEDSEIFAEGAEYGIAGWGGRGVVKRSWIHGSKDGIKDDVDTEQVTIDNLWYVSGTHGDCVQLQNSGDDVTHRFLYADAKFGNDGQESEMANAAFMIKNDLGDGTTQKCVVEDSFINGGNYTVFVRNGPAGPTAADDDVAFRRCKFGGEAKYGTRLSDGGPWDYRRNTIDGIVDYSNLDYSLLSDGSYEWDVTNVGEDSTP